MKHGKHKMPIGWWWLILLLVGWLTLFTGAVTLSRCTTMPPF